MSSLDILGCIRTVTAEVRIRADLWRTRLSIMHSRVATLVDTRAHDTRTHIQECTRMYTRTFISEWHPVRSSGVDATRQSDRCTKRTRRRPKLNNAWGGSNATFKCVYSSCRVVYILGLARLRTRSLVDADVSRNAMLSLLREMQKLDVLVKSTHAENLW